MKVTMGSKNIVYEKNIMKIIATNVAKYRKEKHLTQEEVAKRADIGFDFDTLKQEKVVLAFQYTIYTKSQLP